MSLSAWLYGFPFLQEGDFTERDDVKMIQDIADYQ